MNVSVFNSLKKRMLLARGSKRQHEQLQQLTFQVVGTLEQHQKKLETMESNVVQYRPHIDELEKYNQQIQECMIFENRHTPYTMGSDSCCLGTIKYTINTTNC